MVSYPSCLAGFEDSIPTCDFFSFRKLFVTRSCCFVVVVFRNGKLIGEMRGGTLRGKEAAWSVKYKSIEFCCTQKQSRHKFKHFQVKLQN